MLHKKLSLVLGFCFIQLGLDAQEAPSLSEKLAQTVMQTWKDSFSLDNKPAKWAYDQALFLKSIETVWYNTANPAYFDYIQKSMDFFVDAEGKIRTYKLEEYNIDNVLAGRVLLTLFKVTGKEKYYKAATTLRSQLSTHPRTNEGGFWHKKRYPYQMWLDGLYMAEPFYAEYTDLFKDDSSFIDIAHQLIWMEKHSRDEKTGLLYHGWDESKQEKWSDKQTGLSPNIWARAMGWYGMALVDVLDFYPQNNYRDSILQILKRYADAVKSVQDAKTGLWYDLPALPTLKGNYLESSASAIFIYTIAKACRKGWLPLSYQQVVYKAQKNFATYFIEEKNGKTNLLKTVSVSGLGGQNPYRDGSTAYYLSEKVITNDPKGLGAAILACSEMEKLPLVKMGKNLTVTLDNFFNNEYKKDIRGNSSKYHYVWDEKAYGGFSLWQDVFSSYGIKSNTLTTAPTEANLAATNIFVMVDPDTKKETENPNFIEAKHVTAINNWVKKGGIFILLLNDKGNCEFEHANKLAQSFGFEFNEDSRNHVEGNNFDDGAIKIDTARNFVFRLATTLYLKEISTINIKDKQVIPVIQDGKDVLAVMVPYGKGCVFAIGDPWLYNEYADGRKIPAKFKNYLGMHDLVRWCIKQYKKSKITK